MEQKGIYLSNNTLQHRSQENSIYVITFGHTTNIHMTFYIGTK